MRIELDPINFIIDLHRFMPGGSTGNFKFLSFDHKHRNFYIFDKTKHENNNISRDEGNTYAEEEVEVIFVLEYLLSY